MAKSIKNILENLNEEEITIKITGITVDDLDEIYTEALSYGYVVDEILFLRGTHDAEIKLIKKW